MTWISDILALINAQPWELAERLLVAALLGGIVGLEREVKHHAAGLRTNIVVALGACLFTILSLTAFAGTSRTPDSARVAAQIVSGIGFLGAGAVFRDKDRVRGLTTAATIWLVAAVGMAAGVGDYFLAIVATIMALIVLVLLRPVANKLPTGKSQHPHREGAE
jgi:putative Mg2+ transporter-C (MgtC) family protein